MIEIDADLAIALLREAVETRGPEFVYEKRYAGVCLYAYNGQPDCGVGVALNLAGVPVGVLERHMSYINQAATLHRLEVAGFAVTGLAAAVFFIFQSHQDNQEPWGNALFAAERFYRNVRKGGWNDPVWQG